MKVSETGGCRVMEVQGLGGGGEELGIERCSLC